MEAIDIVMLTHDRLEHLVATVEALRERTPEPYRLTVVDNASGPEVRSWLAEHRDLFARVITQSTNDHVPSFQHGIEATTSDPFIVTDPDLVVPDLEPSWLAQMVELLDRHPDFGLIGVDLDRSNFPGFLDAAQIDMLRNPGETLDGGRLIEGNVGTHFMLIRRDALQTPFVSDIETCRSVRAAGYRSGVTPAIKAFHLGFVDHERYPDYVREKGARGEYYPDYQPVLDRVRPAPSLESLAQAGPIAQVVRAAGVPDEAILELAWRPPSFGTAVPGVISLHSPRLPLPLDDDSAQAVVLADPPVESVPAALAEATRIAARLVVLRSSLDAMNARLADELAPDGWRGHELWAVGQVQLGLARQADRDSSVAQRLGLATVERSEEWLRFFAAGAFNSDDRRLVVLEADRSHPGPDRVRVDEETLARFREAPRAETRAVEARSSMADTAGLVRRLLGRLPGLGTSV